MQKANETRVEKADGLKLVKEFAATLEKEVASKNTVLLVSTQGRRENSEGEDEAPASEASRKIPGSRSLLSKITALLVYFKRLPLGP